MRSLELHRLSGMDESSGDRIACDFSGGARLRRHGGGGRNVVEELESPPWSVGSTAEPTYWSGGGAAEPLLGGLTCALGGNGASRSEAAESHSQRPLSGLGRPESAGPSVGGRRGPRAQKHTVTFGEHRVIVEGADGRGLGDLAQEASPGGAGAGQSVEARVRQRGEGEGIGWRKVCAQRRRCPANVVDNRGHEGSLFRSAPLRDGCVVDVTNSRFC